VKHHNNPPQSLVQPKAGQLSQHKRLQREKLKHQLLNHDLPKPSRQLMGQDLPKDHHQKVNHDHHRLGRDSLLQLHPQKDNRGPLKDSLQPLLK
jgi:hypothetical protein